MAKRSTTYNLILKAFTKLNNKLPEEQKLSLKERRKIIKEVIYPAYKNVPHYKIRKKPIKQIILDQIANIPPKEICDINYIDPSFYALIEWFEIDDTISNLIPDCIYVKISAGIYGETKIFNTRNYEYSSKGVKAIVENIRPDANDNPSGTFLFSAYKKLRPRKKDDGTSENYYLDFILYIDEAPQGEESEVEYKLPRTKENSKKKKAVTSSLQKKMKELKAIKRSKARIKKTLENKIKKYTAGKRKLEKSKKARPSTKSTVDKDFKNTIIYLSKIFSNGKITKEQYDAAIKKLFK